ncbi:MAG: hypothetical protein LC643_04050, partial [Bacteroidales bacterium]|nr:hypothetical protein [Bacteroidales bacterium]
MKRCCLLLLVIFMELPFLAQTVDERYRLPLTEVLTEFEARYGMRISVSGQLIKDLELDFALWRFRPDPEVTLRNILGPFDLSFEQRGDSSYRITPFAYHKLLPSEGATLLAHLSERYQNAVEWEKRKSELQHCLREALNLENLPEWEASRALVTKVRKYKDYTVENVALETLPGVYVFGSVYTPRRIKGKVPVIVSPNGHFSNGRYNKDIQARCATLARMGAIVMNYDLFAWGESALQFEATSHRTSLAQVMQTMNGFRVLDYLLTLPQADPERVGITGGSGGGSQTMLLTALDDRYSVSVPAVMLSAYFFGGCPCESGRPIHLCGQGTSNAEITALFAPRPQLIISDGGDWTAHVPVQEFPFVERIYRFYDAPPQVLQNAHFAEEGHNYGPSKRYAMYDFMQEWLGLKS